MIVNGNDAVAYIFDGGLWKPYVCGTSVTLNVITDFIETSVSGSGLFATFSPTKNSFTGNMQGVVSLNVTGSLTLPDLRQKQIAQTVFLLRFQRTDEIGNTYTDEANFFIISSSDTGSFESMNIFDIGLQGTGKLTQVFTPVVPIPVGAGLVYRYEYTAVGGETGFTDAELAGKTILEVNIDGISYGPIIISGTPVGKEIKYITASGQFVWPPPAEAGEEIYVLYQ